MKSILRPLSLFALFSPFFLVLLVTLRAEEPGWTGWRGGNRDARIENFTPPAEWPESLERLWTTEVGSGYASPLVSGNRVYQHARVGDREVLWCLDLDTGKPVWRKSTQVPFEAGRGGERHGLGPKSTPTLADGRVFTLSITGILSAWSAKDGTLLWKRNFQEDLKVTHPYWGAATSPVVDGDRLFVHPGSCENGVLYCLDPATGENRWARKDDPNCYSSPLVETFNGVRQLIEFNHTGLCGIDVTNGQLLWKHPFPHLGNKQNTPTPARHDDLLLVGGEDRGAFAVKPTKSGDEWQVELIWRHRDASFDMSSPVVTGGLAYGLSQFKMGQIVCLDPQSGKVLWEGEPRTGENAQFLALPGHLLALSNDGTLWVLKTGGEKYQEVIRKYRVAGDDTWTAPALAGNQLLIKAGDSLSVWRFPGTTEAPR